jgi:HEAT repeat protein
MLKSATFAFVLLGLGSLAAPALAGRGSSPGAIKTAIASGSVDAISAELERSEQLVCAGCVDDVRPLVDHPDRRVRQVAAWWLARRGLRSELFIEMATRLGAPDSRKAEAAADVLGSLRTTKAVEPLGAALNNPAFDAQARAAMAAALGRIGDPAGAPALGAASQDPNATVRAAALDAARELRGPLDARIALARLRDADEAVRVAAIHTLGASRGLFTGASREEATAALATVLRQDARARVRRKAAWALGEIKADVALGALALSAAQKDADPSVRALAGVALSKLGR